MTRGRILTGPDSDAPRPDGRPAPQHRAVAGSGYITREGEAFARRAIPKVKGKAAAKAAKKARRLQRERAGAATPNRQG